MKPGTWRSKLIPHHAEPLTLADHAHVVLGVRDPVLAGWGLVWRMELGQGEAFFRSSVSLLVRAVGRRRVCGSAAWKRAAGEKQGGASFASEEFTCVQARARHR